MPPKPKPKPKRPWPEIAFEAQNHRDASVAVVPGYTSHFQPNSLPKNSLPLPSQILDQHAVKITEALPEELVKLLADGTLKAKDVVLAFLQRAVVAQNLTNCITELLPGTALGRAEELDAYFAEHGKPIGPLHGLPISVKEMIGMKGYRLNAGYVAWWNKTAQEEAHVLQILSNAGAVFFARTTEPQSMMHLETDSNLYGVTVNPYNRSCTSGGSSGGEGALIGMRGSCLGIGSDIGGSIRSPAANCGIYGLKPTAFRIPTDGWCSTPAGCDPIPAVIGPLSTSLSGLNLFMSTIIASQPWLAEPALIPLPWTPITISPSLTQPLKIAIMWHDGVVTPHPPITRALQEVVTRLKTLDNVQVVDWKGHLHDEAWAIISSLYFTDGGAADAATIAESGEPWLSLTEFIIKENPCVKKLSMQKLYYWQEEREAYRKEYAKVWNETASSSASGIEEEEEEGQVEAAVVDVILCPVGPGVAPMHNTARYWGYTSLWNLLDYPAVVFPVSKVDSKIDDTRGRKFEAMTDVDEEHWKLYHAKEFDGLPISLQLVGRRFEDEKVLAVLEYLQQSIKLPFVEFP